MNVRESKLKYVPISTPVTRLVCLKNYPEISSSKSHTMNRNPLLVPAPFRDFRRAFTQGVLCLLAILVAPVASAAEGGVGIIEGYTTNAATGLPIARARIIVRPAFQETLTDDEGYYRFTGIPSGEAQLEITYLGFNKQNATVTVTPGATATRDFVLAREQTGQTKDDGVVMLEKFSVVADQIMGAQAIAMNEQRHAPNIKNVIAFEELADQGQENIGDYLRFLPGVAIVDDGDEASSIALGGFPPEMSMVRLDGGDIASTGVGEDPSRTLSLSQVPMVNIERIEVTKVPTPDMPASGLGGSLNLVTKSIVGTKQPRFSYRLYTYFDASDGITFSGGQKQATSQVSPHFKQPSFSVSLTYPLTRNLAFSLGFSRTWRQRDFTQENATWNLKTEDQYINMGPPERSIAIWGALPATSGTTKDIAMASAQWTQVSEIKTTENMQATLEWKLSRNDSLAYTIQYREASDERASNRITTNFHEKNRYDPRGDGSYAEKKPETSYNTDSTRGGMGMGGYGPLNYENFTEGTHMTLRYKHRGTWNIDGQVVYSDQTRIRTSNGKGYFAGVSASVSALSIRGDGINSTESILPALYSVTNEYGEMFNIHDGGNYDIIGVSEEEGTFKTTRYSGRLDIERHLGRNFTFKFGGAYSKEEKDDRRFQTQRSFAPTSSSGGSLPIRASYYDVLDEDLNITMNGTPVRWISPVKLYKLYQTHPHWFPLNAQNIPKAIAEKSVLLEETISAAYARFDLRLLENRLNMTAGVRFEKTKLDGWSMLEDHSAIYVKDGNGIPIKDENGQFVKLPGIEADPVRAANLIYHERASHAGQSYSGLYPSINASYAITENLILRVAYARTIGRPDVQYVAGGMLIPAPDVEEEILDGNVQRNTRILVVGNPGLEPWTADSFHLSMDSYHYKGGFGSVGVYRKNVKNFFAQTFVPLTYDNLKLYELPDNIIEYYINGGDDYSLRRWENIGDASLTGLELTYRQDLLFLPPWLKNMQLWVNYTHLYISGPNAEDFTGFTPDALSWGVNFIRPRYSVMLSWAYQAETKKRKSIGGTGGENYLPDDTYDYQAANTTFDISAEYSISKAFSLYLTWRDVFANDRILYRRASDTPGYAQKFQRTTAPSYFMLGIKGTF